MKWEMFKGLAIASWLPLLVMILLFFSHLLLFQVVVDYIKLVTNVGQAEEIDMFEVAYIIKDANGYIKEQKAKFHTLQDAIKHVRNLNSNMKVVGKPSIERV